MTKKLTIVLIALTVLLLAINSSAESSEQALKALYKAAKVEGEVILQYKGSLKPIKPVLAAFRARYPDIKLTAFSFSSGRLATRVIGEAAAGKLSMDVGNLRPYNLIPLMERDLVVKHDWTKLGVPQEGVLLDGLCVLYNENPRVWVRNTNLVSKAAEPKTWDDLLDPKWKGYKIAMRASATGFAPFYMKFKNDKEKAFSFIKRLGEQQVVGTKRMAIVMSRIASGECQIGQLSMSYVHEMIAEKGPIAICPVSPTADFGDVVFLPKGAAHPNAAKLLIAWLASPEAKKEWLKIGYGWAYPPDASVTARLLHENGIKYERVAKKEDVIEFANNFAKRAVEKMGWKPK